MLSYADTTQLPAWDPNSPNQNAEVNINQDSVKAIARVLEKIGPSKAKRIVSYREKHGPFKAVDELKKVKGIGKEIVTLNRSKIRL